MGTPAVTHHPDVQAVLEGDELFKFFRTFFSGDTRTFDYKWLRFVRPDGWSGPHFDFVYMGRGSEQLHTCWVPFGDVPATMGTLAVLVGSHNLPSFAPIRDTYGKTDVDRDGTPGHFGRVPMEISEKYGGTGKQRISRWEMSSSSRCTRCTPLRRISPIDGASVVTSVSNPQSIRLMNDGSAKIRSLTQAASRFRLRKRRNSGDWINRTVRVGSDGPLDESDLRFRQAQYGYNPHRYARIRHRERHRPLPR